jgi:hypothetical protein
MKLIVSNNRVIATLSDNYEGPHEWVLPPENFDESRALEYIVDESGNLALPLPSVEPQQKPLLEVLESVVEKRLDDFAVTRGYSSIANATTYFNSSIEKYKKEATYAIEARDNTWIKFYEIMNDENRDPPISEFSDIELELPTLEWPLEEVVIEVEEPSANSEVIVEETEVSANT